MNSKKRNWNFVLFIIYLAFTIIGISSISCVRTIGDCVWGVITREYTVENAIETMELTLADGITYHDQMMELDGLRENILGTRIVLKDDTMIVKTDSESLVEVEDRIDEENVFSTVQLIKKLELVSEANGADFLYCAAPRKEFYETVPDNVEDYSFENYELLLEAFTNLNVPFVSLTGALEDSKCLISELFYYTDHHWTSYAGFLANQVICEELNERYDFEYNEQYANINYYNVEKYHDWFLGSKGKKVGSSFTSHGADDFELIVPRFETHLTEVQPFKNEIREGSFEETVLYMENMKKDYYKINTYATYSGGDFRLQIMKNNLNEDGKKIVLVRDSFACAVAPFLALQTSELHVCDVRDGNYYVGDKLNVEEYIKRVKPDFVLVLYTGVYSYSSSWYDFFSGIDY